MIKRNSNQRSQNPSKSLKIPLLMQMDDNLPRVRGWRRTTFQPMMSIKREYKDSKGIHEVTDVDTDKISYI